MHLFFLINFVHSSPHPSEFVASFKMGVLGQNLIDFFGKLQRCVAHHWIRIEQDSPFLVSFVPYACVWALFLLKKNTHTPILLQFLLEFRKNTPGLKAALIFWCFGDWKQFKDFLMFWGNVLAPLQKLEAARNIHVNNVFLYHVTSKAKHNFKHFYNNQGHPGGTSTS